MRLAFLPKCYGDTKTGRADLGAASPLNMLTANQSSCRDSARSECHVCFILPLV